MLQHMPFDVTFAPPSEVTFPPHEAETDLISKYQKLKLLDNKTSFTQRTEKPVAYMSPRGIPNSYGGRRQHEKETTTNIPNVSPDLNR